MTYDQIRVVAYPISHILDMKIDQSINQHATLQLSAMLAEGYNEAYLHQVTKEQPIQIVYDEDQTLFYGLVEKVEIQVQNQYHEVKIQAVSYSKKMDVEHKYRSFQNSQMTSHAFVDMLMKPYGPCTCIKHIPNEPLGNIIIQYNETDWELLRRFVSKYHVGIFESLLYPGIYLTLGTPEEEKEIAPLKGYKLSKDLKTYNWLKENEVPDLSESDFLTYEVESEAHYQLGDHGDILGHAFYVKQRRYAIRQQVLTYTYWLTTKKGLSQPKERIHTLVGGAIDGKVIDVAGDKVRIHLTIDPVQNKEEAYWFIYSTMAASEDGSGWYCMPELGDKMRVYFPTLKEKEAFAISSVSDYDIPAGEEDRMGNPDHKYLRTINDKEIKMTPEGLYVACNGKQAQFDMQADGTLHISSQQNVTIEATENINIIAGKGLAIGAKQNVVIQCDKGAALHLNPTGELQERGTSVNNN